MTPRFMINPYANPCSRWPQAPRSPTVRRTLPDRGRRETAFTQRSWRVVPRRRGTSRQVVSFKLAWPC